MEKNKIYLDTSELNFFFEEKDLEKSNSTKEFFRELIEGRFFAYISELVLREIGRASTFKREKLLSLIKTYELPCVDVTSECIVLSEKYVEKKIFPWKYRDDGLHIAIATVYHMDVVVTWNLEHMVKLRTRREIKAINILEGYREIEICTPLEVIESD
jgi:predicted nucleic acid-binding protein